MGLINARNLRRAKLLLDQNKELLEKNRHRVGDVVGKAAVQVDKASGGKTSDITTKLEKAARKYSATAIGADGRPVGEKPLVSDPKPAVDSVIDVDATEVEADVDGQPVDGGADTIRPDASR